MITALDHVVVIVRDIEQGVAAYRTLFAREPAWRSQSNGAATVLFSLDNMSLELLAPSGEGEVGDRVRAALNDKGEGLASLAFRVDDIARMYRRLRRLALDPEEVSEASSYDVISGATATWKRTRAAVSATHGVRLFFLESSAERPRSAATAAAPIVGLDHVVVSTPAPDRAAALYGARLGLEMTLDRTNPDWGARLMFFRCGDLTVEVVHRLKPGAGDSPDTLWGLSWRVADIDPARARLAAAGIDVSDVRTGRKPGTRVFTVRNGTCGIQTLIIQPAASPSNA